MKQKHIDAARELRLWLGQIVLPFVGIIMLSPEARQAVKQAGQDAKNFVQNKMK